MYLTRGELAHRWKTSIRTVDRRRELGLLPWLDLTQGQGQRAQIRFREADVEAFERRAMMNPMREAP